MVLLELGACLAAGVGIGKVNGRNDGTSTEPSTHRFPLVVSCASMQVGSRRVDGAKSDTTTHARVGEIGAIGKQKRWAANEGGRRSREIRKMCA